MVAQEERDGRVRLVPLYLVRVGVLPRRAGVDPSGCALLETVPQEPEREETGETRAPPP